MRYMMIIQADENQPVTQALMDAMGPYMEKNIASGALIDTGGLAKTAQGKQVKLYKGKLLVTDGPFAETKEVFGGYAVLEAASYEDAMRHAMEFMELHRVHAPGWEGRVEVRPMQFSLSEQRGG